MLLYITIDAGFFVFLIKTTGGEGLNSKTVITLLLKKGGIIYIFPSYDFKTIF